MAHKNPSPTVGLGRQTEAATTISLTLPVQLKRAGIETRLIIDGDDKDARRRTDRSLRRLMAQSYRYREMLLRSGKSMSELTAEAGDGISYFSRIVRLGFLAPDAVKAILADRHTLELTATRLGKDTRLPVDWERQLELLGIRGPTNAQKSRVTKRRSTVRRFLARAITSESKPKLGHYAYLRLRLGAAERAGWGTTTVS